MMLINLSDFLMAACRRLTFLSYYCLLLPALAYGQRTYPLQKAPPNQSPVQTADTLELDINEDIGTQLIPFDEIIKIATAYSPLIKFENESINSLDAAYRLSKVQVLQNASGFASYSAGNQAIFSTTSYGGDALGQIANGYRAGVNLQISLYDLFGRGHQIRQTKANARAAIHRRDAVELQLKRDLIITYQDLQTAQRVFKVRIAEEQAALTALRISEIELQKGKINLAAFSSINNYYAQSKASTEEARGTFLKNIYILEATVGVSLRQLKRK